MREASPYIPSPTVGTLLHPMGQSWSSKINTSYSEKLMEISETEKNDFLGSRFVISTSKVKNPSHFHQESKLYHLSIFELQETRVS